MSSSAIKQTARQNIHVTKQQAAAYAPTRREADARLHTQQARAREARAVAAAKRAEVAAREAARLATASAEATTPTTTPETASPAPSSPGSR